MPDVWELASVVARLFLYLGVLGSAGLVLVRLVFGRALADPHGRMVGQARALALVAAFAGGLGFVLKGAALSGDAAGMADPEMLGLLWNTPDGPRLLALGAGLAVVLAGLQLPRAGIPVAVAGGAVAVWSFSRIGHVADAGSVWLDAALFLHLSAAAFWIGVLSPLRNLAADPGALTEAAELGRRFGRIAAIVVPALAAAGVFMAWRLVGDVGALAGTAYGVTLLAKIGGVTVLLAAAAANRLRFVPAMTRGDSGAAVRLRRSIAVEWAAVWAILLATATLTGVFDLPGRPG